MIDLLTRLFARRSAAVATALALIALLSAAQSPAVAAQAQPEEFILPSPTSSPAPAPAGPADERAGVTIPPRPMPNAVPSAMPNAVPSPVPSALPTATVTPRPTNTAGAIAATPAASPPAPAPVPSVVPPKSAPVDQSAPQAEALLPAAAQTPPTGPAPVANPDTAAPSSPTLPELWLWAAGGLGTLVLLGGGAALWRRRKPRVLRLAGPVASPLTGTGETAPAPDFTQLELMLEITGATRSVMMFTLQYRLTITNRSDRAVADLGCAVQLVCARASANAGAPSAGAAQSLSQIARVGPHQARSVTGAVQLPLAAIAPLRQGITPLFIPLAHVTIEGEGQRAMNRSFVIGTPSGGGAGRVHPIPLDQPPGAVPGLVAQGIAVPANSAAA